MARPISTRRSFRHSRANNKAVFPPPFPSLCSTLSGSTRAWVPMMKLTFFRQPHITCLLLFVAGLALIPPISRPPDFNNNAGVEMLCCLCRCVPTKIMTYNNRHQQQRSDVGAASAKTAENRRITFVALPKLGIPLLLQLVVARCLGGGSRLHPGHSCGQLVCEAAFFQVLSLNVFLVCSLPSPVGGDKLTYFALYAALSSRRPPSFLISLSSIRKGRSEKDRRGEERQGREVLVFRRLDCEGPSFRSARRQGEGTLTCFSLAWLTS